MGQDINEFNSLVVSSLKRFYLVKLIIDYIEMPRRKYKTRLNKDIQS